MHLVLPQVRNKKYIAFYQKRRKEGDILILDNGAYEGQVLSSLRFEERIKLYNPQIIVCPDAYLKPKEITLTLTEQFLDKFYPKFKHESVFMGVPQAEPNDLDNWWECCKLMLEDKRLTWIALPRCLYTDFGQDITLRAQLAKKIYKLNPKVKIHALGMANGSLEELYVLAKCKKVSSCDSSAPVWRGWNLSAIDDILTCESWDKVGMPVDFNAQLHTTSEQSMIEYNLKKVLFICQ
jgi:hypothetical protein